MNTKKKFIPYILFGYPTIEESYRKALTFADTADIFEIGFPYSDPIADGRVIVDAARIALKNKISFIDYLEFIKKLKDKITAPIYAMTYYNPILKYGIEKFMKSEIDGFIIPDLIIEESGELLKIAKKYNKKSVFIITPDTLDDRIKKISEHTTGFIYFVTYAGVTGKNVKLTKQIIDKIKKIKEIVNCDVNIGFGIRKIRDIDYIYKYTEADGVIVGSAIIKNEITSETIKQFKNAKLATPQK
ncbi:MAG TPA: tryptophan synthase subunit alpha [bacterium]|nr:tryptophan synthase subunit alpha [bacterium]HPP87566.1 tryptophan synthase subunit alpha [bacterium]